MTCIKQYVTTHYTGGRMVFAASGAVDHDSLATMVGDHFGGVPAEAAQDGHNMFDLSREIAFNMSLIYQASGNHHLARMYTEKYITL